MQAIIDIKDSGTLGNVRIVDDRGIPHYLCDDQTDACDFMDNCGCCWEIADMIKLVETLLAAVLSD